MKPWKAFEKRIKVESQMLGITCIKVPNHLEKARIKSGALIDVERKTEFDFCAGIDGIAMFFDAKYVSSENYLSLNELTRPQKYHQYSALVDAWAKGNISGYVAHLFKIQTICWIPITTVMNLIDHIKQAEAHNQNNPNDKQPLPLKRIMPSVPGVISQPDDRPIDLRRLTWNQRLEIVNIIKGS